ncbi:MAG: hypothetical protein LBH08_03240 [Puniceicoccales bacterium]|jgi:hypothetical protein|nr:hypothetical protein [Puniceicoccales bacterium]
MSINKLNILADIKSTYDQACGQYKENAKTQGKKDAKGIEEDKRLIN